MLNEMDILEDWAAIRKVWDYFDLFYLTKDFFDIFIIYLIFYIYIYTLQKSQHSILKNVVIFEEYTFFSHDAPAFEEIYIYIFFF